MRSFKGMEHRGCQHTKLGEALFHSLQGCGPMQGIFVHEQDSAKKLAGGDEIAGMLCALQNSVEELKSELLALRQELAREGAREGPRPQVGGTPAPSEKDKEDSGTHAADEVEAVSQEVEQEDTEAADEVEASSEEEQEDTAEAADEVEAGSSELEQEHMEAADEVPGQMDVISISSNEAEEVAEEATYAAEALDRERFEDLCCRGCINGLSNKRQIRRPLRRQQPRNRQLTRKQKPSTRASRSEKCLHQE